MTPYADLARRGAAELGAAAAAVDPAEIDALVTALSDARRIVVAGVGREGLMMRALAMRLFHLGLAVHVVGDMTTPPVGPGDLLVVSAGPGDLSTIRALVGVATASGARCACITAQPGGAVPRLCDPVLTITAQTMADDIGPAPASALPMGSVFEGAQFLVFECLVLILRDQLGTSADTMRANHTNLE